VTYRVRRGALVNLVAVVEQDSWASESWTQQGTREAASADFTGLHPTVTTILERADAHCGWALFERDPLPAWAVQRVALLGDACHPMLPFQAQGAAMAIEDAWLLATHLEHAPDVTLALQRYADARLPRTSRVQARSRANAAWLHHASAASRAALAAGSRLIGGRVAAALDWIYGYDVTAETT
jgi:salicylate hydroxylase